jgi:hypothetical protein
MTGFRLNIPSNRIRAIVSGIPGVVIDRGKLRVLHTRADGFQRGKHAARLVDGYSWVCDPWKIPDGELDYEFCNTCVPKKHRSELDRRSPVSALFASYESSPFPEYG